jgi:hypothetical protein
MGIFDTWSKNRSAKQQATWEAHLAEYQSANYFNKPAALITLPTPAYKRYQDAEWKAWYEATGSEELYRFYATRMPPQFIYNTNAFYRASRGSDIPALHYNLAQVITKTMSNLIFSKEPQLSIDTGNKRTDARYQTFVDDFWKDNDKMAFLRKAAEIESYSGAVGIKFIVDTNESDYPIMQLYARPEIEIRKKYDRIEEIVFKDYYPVDGDVNPFVLYSVYGKGYIRYEMYQESWNPASQVLQMTRVNLDHVPSCRGLQDIKFISPDGSESKKILAFYKENKEDARSDYYGIIDDMMFLDELYSNMADFMRKSKIKTYLHDNAVVKDTASDGSDRTTIPSAYDTSNIWIPDSNPNWTETEIKRDAIPVKDSFEGYADLFEKTLAKTLSTVGLSINTVLMNHEDTDDSMSGVALSIKEKASIRTRNDKINCWSKALKSITDIGASLYGVKSFGSGSEIAIGQGISIDSIKAKFPEYEDIAEKDKIDIITKKLNAGLMTRQDAWQELYPQLDPDEIDAKIKEADEDKKESMDAFTPSGNKKIFSPKDALSKMNESSDKKISSDNK